MNKKGFTLIELLAVIVILAVIAIIVTPVVTGIITKTKLSADMRSAEGYVKEAETIYSSSLINDSKKGLIGINMIKDVNEALNRNNPGTLIVNDKGQVNMAIKINDKCYKKDIDQGINDISVSDDLDNCKASITQVEPPIDCFDYTKVDSSNITITNYKCGVPIADDSEIQKQRPGKIYTDIIIPETIEGIPVTKIGNSAFKSKWYDSSLTGGYNKGINSVKLPSQLKSIDKFGFQYSGVSDIIFNDGLQSIGAFSFDYCNLSEVIIPNTVTQLLDFAFSDNQIKKINIPNNLTTISDGIFKNNQIESVIIPSTVTSIGIYSFNNNNIKDLVIPDTIINIGIYAFNGNKLPEDKAVFYKRQDSNSDGIVDYDKSVIVGYGGANDNFVVPNTVNTIDSYSFQYSNLKGVTIPSSVTTIGASAFSSNYLSSVIIPDSVTLLGDNAFNNNLLQNVVIGKGLSSLGTRVFSENLLTHIDIPSNITSIGWNCFRLNHLTSIDIPSTVVNIEVTAFAQNDLTRISLPDNNLTIGLGAFNGNKMVGNDVFIYNHTSDGIDNTTLISYAGIADDVTIPSNVVNVSKKSFLWTNVRKISVPNSVTTIGSNAFRTNTTLLKTINIDNTSGSITGAPWGTTTATINWLR